MSNKPKIYDSANSLDLSLENLVDIYRRLGVDRIIYKILAPNDNSKNQPYLAGHFTDIGFIPTGELQASASTSTKTNDPKRQIKFTAGLNFHWLSPEGQVYPAPTAKLIYYPQFPEVRLSGFLQGSPIDMGGWMDPSKLGRSEGRVLLFGVRSDGAIFAFLATPNSRVSREIHGEKYYVLSSVLRELPYAKHKPITEQTEFAIRENLAPYHVESDARRKLISELRRIYLAGQITSKKLNRDGVANAYTARNGGGYTLEAELGIMPNGIAEPDYHGWEIKQFGVKKFELVGSKALTLMTPEPDGGLYKNEGVKSFIRSYGYRSANIADRYDFTGRHFASRICEKSGLTLVTTGFDCGSKSMVDATGFIGLLDKNDNIAASWSYTKLLTHWKQKHARAAYIPSIAIDLPDGHRAYCYGGNVRLYEGTDINKLLGAIVDQHVYYDPGIKMEQASTKEVVKKRSQFRIKSNALDCLYNKLDEVDVTL
ncbi:MvaI/BcnI family restriction endonuclease [Simiduia curdlanivorans]|uniref:MvaI/BcnI family restriction endonuclease n=1 Tax=Simiduia curdlanivorans TaxID=1492769 RepID=A0ABV8V7G5_9GAMM|nr:MvaI/BcnI family restriction endonuclease [Simiduia curdlanivorans]MDN3638772.1 MvaI/BcnI family restriction endonuclease [Simiduia curdlanivorans]